MAPVTFKASEASIDASILSSKSTVAKVCFEPRQIFADAKLQATRDADIWVVDVAYTPTQVGIKEDDTDAILYLTKGELGKVLGTVKLSQTTS